MTGLEPATYRLNPITLPIASHTQKKGVVFDSTPLNLIQK